MFFSFHPLSKQIYILIVGAQLNIGQYIKLGRIWFKIKETSYEKEKELEDVQIKSKSSSSSIENTDALISREGDQEDLMLNQSKNI